MTTITRVAPAKINLFLSVGSRREDGYHGIRSVMQTITLSDTVTMTQTPDSPGVSLSVTGPEAGGVPADATNLVHKAAARLQKIAAARRLVSGSKSGLHISLEKRIPSQAGLGGGSSDAAATLKALDRLFHLNLTQRRLTEIAASLGADIPFFLFEGRALVEGVGERVTPLPPFTPPWPLVIVKPPVRVSTALAYATLDAVPNRISGEGEGNDFESVIFPALPAVQFAYDLLLAAPERHPDTLPLLCGSGSALFCRTRSDEQADVLAKRLESERIGKVWRTQTTGE